jgi:hypothetical protein
MIGKEYAVTVKNDWYVDDTHIKIIDHRLSRTFKEDFALYAQVHNKDYVKNDTPSSQLTYQYEFVAQFSYPYRCPWERGGGSKVEVIDKRPRYSTHNDIEFLDFLWEYCEEADELEFC